jgi:3-hydroxyacyl-[acyl-carrier-protein] dehydratase
MEPILPAFPDTDTPNPTASDMRFSQLDRILTLEKGKSITAVKGLALSEEYLQDHFPRFPIMPGVLMMESMFQASMWLVRVSTDFQFAKVRLRQSKSVKFQGFVQPGSSLIVSAEIKSQKDSLTTLKVSGSIDGSVATSGRLVLDAFNMAEREGLDPALDHLMNNKFRRKYKIMCDQLDPSGPALHTPAILAAT